MQKRRERGGGRKSAIPGELSSLLRFNVDRLTRAGSTPGRVSSPHSLQEVISTTAQMSYVTKQNIRITQNYQVPTSLKKINKLNHLFFFF